MLRSLFPVAKYSMNEHTFQTYVNTHFRTNKMLLKSWPGGGRAINRSKCNFGGFPSAFPTIADCACVTLFNTCCLQFWEESFGYFEDSHSMSMVCDKSQIQWYMYLISKVNFLKRFQTFLLQSSINNIIKQHDMILSHSTQYVEWDPFSYR